jgi:hypothetical protein
VWWGSCFYSRSLACIILNKMSNKNLLITISVVLGLLLVSLLGYYFILRTNNVDTDGGVVSGFKSFFPFGGNDASPTTNDDTSTTTETVDTDTVNKPLDFNMKLRKVSSEPVAGAGTLDVKAGTVIRYIEKATGHIFEVELFSPRRDRISNTTIPVVYDAVWGNTNNSLVARYLKEDNQTVDTYSLTIKNTSTSTENVISGISFPGNVVDVSALGTKVFYLLSDSSSSSGYISNFDGSKTTKIWGSKIKELTSQFVNVKTVALTTKPSPNVSGFMYFVDTTNGQVRKILGDISGLVGNVSSDASRVLYVSQTDVLKMYILDTKTSVSTRITPETLPEKCVWSKKQAGVVYCAVPKQDLNGSSMINWYLGSTEFNDYIWKYDIINNTASIISDLSTQSGSSIDVIKPVLSENEQYLVFVNKIDNSLWSLDLTK